MKISAVIIVKNAEQTIRTTLESLKAFDEVLIYDNGSMDKTLPIAGKFENVKIIIGQFTGFGETKNTAASYAKNNWIFSIDSDEVISPRLLQSIFNTKIQIDTVYGFERYNYYRKKRVRFSGWRKETIYRLYNRQNTEFNNKKVHEGLKLENRKTELLKGELKHYSYQKISDFNRKRALYSDLFASENKGKKKSSPIRAVISASYDFFNTYFLRLGFLDGYRGLLISFSNFSVTFFKYLKLYEANLNNDIKTSLIITTHNCLDTLNRTLESILCQTIPPDEIIIADNGSTNDTRDFIKKFAKSCFIPIKHILTGEEEISKAISKAKYEYLILIKGNVILHKKFVCDHICKAKPDTFVASSNIELNNKTAIVQYKENATTDAKIITPNFIELFFTVLTKKNSCKIKKEPQFKQTGYSFYKADFYNNNILKTETVFEKLTKNGVKKVNLKLTGIQYTIADKTIADQKKNVLVCLDRLKLINCGLGQVALNYGRELLDIKASPFAFDFLLPEKGFSEFEQRVGHIKLNLFRRIFSAYMKPYDLCHITHQFPSYSFGEARKNILTIHDLNFIYTKSKSKNNKYLRALQKNINKADAIVFISRFTKQTVNEHLSISENKIQKVIYNGVQTPSIYKTKPNWLPDKRFVFSIGQFLKKKNFHVLLPFMKLLPEDYILVIAGEKETSYGHELLQIIKNLKIETRVIFPGGISEEDRNFLYNKCEAFLFPSIAEGFGLPVIEAMLCSKPVFCSDRTSLREIGSEFAFFWNSFEPNKMLEVFNAGLETFKTDNYQERQKEYANTYTYKKNVQEYLQLYEDLLQQA